MPWFFQVGLIERSLMHGDVVRRTSEPSGQLGYIYDCLVLCFLQVKGTNQIIPSVNSKLLTDCYVSSICTPTYWSSWDVVFVWSGSRFYKGKSVVFLLFYHWPKVCSICWGGGGSIQGGFTWLNSKLNIILEKTEVIRGALSVFPSPE